MTSWRFALAALAALCVSACLPVTTKTAVGSTVDFINDPALEGTWTGKVDKSSQGSTYFHFLANEGESMTLLGVTTKQDQDKGGWSMFALTTATLGSHRYINAREISDDGKPATPDKQATNIPLLYTISGDTLTLYLLDEDATTAAIAAHKIAGIVIKSQYSTDVAITADAAHLDALLKSDAGAKLFKVFVVLKRVK